MPLVLSGEVLAGGVPADTLPLPFDRVPSPDTVGGAGSECVRKRGGSPGGASAVCEAGSEGAYCGGVLEGVIAAMGG